LPRKTAKPPLAADYGTDVHFDNGLTHTASATGNSRGSRILWKMGKYKIFPGPEQPISEPGKLEYLLSIRSFQEKAGNAMLASDLVLTSRRNSKISASSSACFAFNPILYSKSKRDS
jgi:hypothetical protein